MGSVERVLDTLGFAHTTWQVPSRHKVRATGDDYRSYAALFVLWMKQNIAQGRVPIYGAKVDTENDPAYDHIMPAYEVQFWSESSTNSTSGATPSGGNSSSSSSSSNRGNSGSSSSSSSSKGGVSKPAAGTSMLDNAGSLPSQAWPKAAVMQSAAAIHPKALQSAAVVKALQSAAVVKAAAGEAAALVAGGVAAAGATSGSELHLEIAGEASTEDANADDGEEDEGEDDENGEGRKADTQAGLSSDDGDGADEAQGEEGAAEPTSTAETAVASTAKAEQGPHSAQHVTGWLSAQAPNPLLAGVTGLYSFNAGDVLGWANGYGTQIKRGVSESGFFADRATCRMSDVEGGCISTNSPSYAVAMGGLVQPSSSKPPAAAAAAAVLAAVVSTPPHASDGAAAAVLAVQDSAVPVAGSLSLAEPHSLFKPLRLTVTAWSAGNAAASHEPLPRHRASATGYMLDVSGCAATGQPFTVFRFDGYLAFRSTGRRSANGKAVLANPGSVQELNARCVASKKGCRRATFVQAEGLRVGVREFGPFSANGSTYFVCVSEAVPAQVTV